MTQHTGIAIVGAAHPHANGVATYLPKLPAIQTRWVWDPSPQRATEAAALFAASIASDYSVILDDPQVQAVMIFAETDRHHELVEKAIATGKHIYVDKPLAINAHHAWRLAALLDNYEGLFSSGFVLRRRAHHQYLRQLIRQNAFGGITRIRHTNGHNGAIRGLFDSPQYQWFIDPKQAGGGGFLDEGTHSADMILWLLGQLPTRVTAAVANATGRYPQCEEFGQGLMAFDSGTIACISGSWVDTTKTATLEISGTQGAAVVVGDRDLYLTTPHIEGADGKTPWKQMPPGLDHPQVMFLNAITGGSTEHLVSAHDAAASAAVIHTMIAAAHANQWLDVPVK